MERTSQHVSAKLLVGIFIVILGVLFLADNHGYLDADDYLRYWPVILLVVGVVNVVRPEGRLKGAIFLIVGTWILLFNTGIVDLEIRVFWPLILVGLGVMLVWRALSGANPPSSGLQGGVDESTINSFALMSAVVRKNGSPAFLGGDLTAVMGGCEIDLTQAQLGAEEVTIDTLAIWGGIEIKVPPDWTVVGKVMPIMGGFSDSTRAPRDGSKRFIVKGTAIMGGIEVKN